MRKSSQKFWLISQCYVPHILWKKRSLSNYLLLPISAIYLIVFYLRKLLYFRCRYISQTPIICVGNILAGGTGKTPIVAALAGVIQKKLELKPVIITRGYKGALVGPVLVTADHNHEQIGDEAMMLREYADIVVTKNRLHGLKFISDMPQKYDFIITDDGLQDPRFIADLKILVEDRNIKHNNMIIPAGPKRCLNIDDIDLKIIYNGDVDKDIVPNVKIDFTDLDLSEDYIAFCGIGYPEKFFTTCLENNIKLVEKITYPDHHIYCESDIIYLSNLAKRQKAKLLTTAKDSVKLEDISAEISCLNIKIEFSEHDLLQLINNIKKIVK